jgi:hypothetical protein
MMTRVYPYEICVTFSSSSFYPPYRRSSSSVQSTRSYRCLGELSQLCSHISGHGDLGVAVLTCLVRQPLDLQLHCIERHRIIWTSTRSHQRIKGSVAGCPMSEAFLLNWPLFFSMR